MNYTRANQLLSKYLSDKSAGQGGETALTGLSVYYGGLPTSEKDSICKFIMNRAEKAYSETNKTECLLLADLYESFTLHATDPNFTRLYYIRGEYAATEGDTITLKRQIQNIETFTGGHEETATYLKNLQDYLEEIRNFVPVDKTIDGVWVGEWGTKTFGEPLLMLEINPSSDYHTVFALSNKMGMFSGWEKPIIAQEAFAFSEDSVYLAFSNEDLQKPSPFLNEMLRTCGNTYASVLGMKTSLSSGSSLVGNLTGTAASVAVDAIVGSIFAPRKYSFFLEMKLRKINDWQIEADIALHECKVKGDNEPKFTNNEYHGLFTKVRREDNWYWYDGYSDIITPFEMNKEEDKAFRKQHKCPGSWLEKRKSRFNRLQTLKMIYLTEIRLANEEVATSNLPYWHREKIRPVLGVQFEENPSSLKIDKVITPYPAERAGIESGDIITHFDGYEISTRQQLFDLIDSKQPYDKVEITVIHKKEKRTVTVELSLS